MRSGLLLDQVYDLERLNGRIMLGSCNGRDLLALRDSLARLPQLAGLLTACRAAKLEQIAA